MMMNKHLENNVFVLPSQSKSSNKPLDMILPDLSVEQRIEMYFDFCRVMDSREDVWVSNPAQFSHRMHWDENPFTEAFAHITDRRQLVELYLVLTFTNEKWDTIIAKHEGRLEEFLSDPNNKAARHDLYQIYYPKGTKVKDFLLRTVPEIAASFEFDNDKTYTQMELAYLMDDHLRTNYGFRSAKYPSKNFARNLSFLPNDFVDPDSWVLPGTGSFRGYQQIFGGKFLMGKAEISPDAQPLNAAGETLLNQFHTLIEHPDNPVYKHQYINHEDKVCFFFKWLALNCGFMKPRKDIPYNWMFPDDFNLKKLN